MKVAVAFSVPITTAPGFAWRWRSEDNKRESSSYFIYYADCTADAQRHGYTVKQVPAHGPGAPGGGISPDLR